jgi:hypothetical protein
LKLIYKFDALFHSQSFSSSSSSSSVLLMVIFFLKKKVKKINKKKKTLFYSFSPHSSFYILTTLNVKYFLVFTNSTQSSLPLLYLSNIIKTANQINFLICFVLLKYLRQLLCILLLANRNQPWTRFAICRCHNEIDTLSTCKIIRSS